MKSLKSRIRRLETAKQASRRKSFIVVSTKPGREADDLAKAKQKHGEDKDLKYLVTYVREPDPLPDKFKVRGE